MLQELLNEQDNSNPTIMIQGFGSMDLTTAKAGAISRIEKALAKLKSNPDIRDWENAKHVLFDAGVVESMMTAIIKNQ
jgi:hypothetical protein